MASKVAHYTIGLLVAAALLSGLLLLPVNQWALLLVQWIHGAGVLGIVVYALAYLLATLLLLPGSILTIGAGFAYGPIWGTALVSPVSVLAATIAFLLGRTVARDWVSRRMQRHPRVAAINEAVGEKGFQIVLLLRLSPIVPFNLLNYALALSRLHLRDYVGASFLGMLPATFLYVYLGSLVTNASELLSGTRHAGGVGKQILYWGGLVATLLAIALITRSARRALKRALQGKRERPAQASEAQS